MTVTQTADGVVIDVRVTPRSSRSEFAGVRDGVLLLRLHAPPVDGAANAEVVKLVATLLGVPKSTVTIATGHRSRLKRVCVRGVSANSVRETLGTDDECGTSPP